MAQAPMPIPSLPFFLLKSNIEELAYAKESSSSPVPGLFFHIFYTHSSPIGSFLNGLYGYLQPDLRQRRYQAIASATIDTFTHHLYLAKACCEIAYKHLFHAPLQLATKNEMEQMDAIMQLKPLCRLLLEHPQLISKELARECKRMRMYQESLIVVYATSLYPPMEALMKTAYGEGSIYGCYDALATYFSYLKKTPDSLCPFFHSLRTWYKEWKEQEEEKGGLLRYKNFVRLLYASCPSFFHGEDEKQTRFLERAKQTGMITLGKVSYKVEAFFNYKVPIEENFATYTVFHLKYSPYALFVPTSPAYTFLLLRSSPQFFPSTQVAEIHRFGQWAFIKKCRPLLSFATVKEHSKEVECLLFTALRSWMMKKVMPDPIPESLALDEESGRLVAYPNLSELKPFRQALFEEFVTSIAREDYTRTKQWLSEISRMDTSLARSTAISCLEFCIREKEVDKKEKIHPVLKNSPFLEEAKKCCDHFFEVLEEQISKYKLSLQEVKNIKHTFSYLLHMYMQESGCYFYIPENTLKMLANQAYHLSKKSIAQV